MPRTWSNSRLTDTRSAAQRARNKPSNLTAFLILLTINLVFFTGLMTYALLYATTTHPVVERLNTVTSEPDPDR